MSKHTPSKATEKDIERWHALIAQRPDGPWIMGNGGSFDRTEIRPISDEMMAELAEWLKMGYTPWNGRSMPLSAGDRQFMYMLYFSVQGLVSRVRAAEKLASAAPELLEALNAMLTHMGMDEDEWNRPTFNQARAAVSKATGAQP